VPNSSIMLRSYSSIVSILSPKDAFEQQVRVSNKRRSHQENDGSGRHGYVSSRLASERVCLRVRPVNKAGASSWVPKDPHSLCARTPMEGGKNFLAFSLSAWGGGKGLHGDQYSLSGTTPARSCTQMTNPDSKDALDFVPSDAYRYRDPKVTYPYFQVEDGMVKHAWAKRDAVVVDGGETSGSSICTSTQNPSLQVGQHVDTATCQGTLVVSPDRGGKTPPRKQRIPVDNVHVTLLHRLAPTTAKYITFVGQTLCGHEVVRCPG
jgi:hypothetical protein